MTGKKIFSSVLVLMALFAFACAGIQEKDAKSPQPAQVQPPKGPSYLDFNDILVPAELSKDASGSYITNGYGRMLVRGRVDGSSVEKFFLTGMPATGWIFMDEYRYQGNIKMFFKKADKISTILISENPMDTRVEIWVTPLR